MLSDTDTIVALSSPPAQPLSAEANQPHSTALSIAIIRLSGAKAPELGDHVFHCDPKIPNLATLTKTAAWRRVPGFIIWSGHELRTHALLMPGPRSYTREHVVELYVPGSKWIVAALIDALVKAGARPAQPGEFTRRAFRNGRITLEQAEAVGQLIAAASADEARAFAGRVSSQSDTQRRKLKEGVEELLSQVELGLDFAHEDVIVIARNEVSARLESLCELAERNTAETLPQRSLIRGMPRILLLGPTNAGKSMLFNALAKKDSAIVSGQRHTTRDFIETVLTFDSGENALSAILIDSAGSGIAATGEAWSATKRELAHADFVLLALDRSLAGSAQEGLEQLAELLAAAPPAGGAIVWTKADLPAASDRNAWVKLPFEKTFEVSALSGENIPLLRSFLADQSRQLNARTAQAQASASAAVQAATHECHEALARARQAWKEGITEDVLAVELREAVHALLRCEGLYARHDAVTEAALDRIFSRFCIGK